MPRGGGRRRRGRHGGGEAEESGERWLLTYADMITLLMALFMVLFSISSVNVSKYKTLQLALKAAFSGDILPGGRSIAQPGSTANSSHAPTSADVQAIVAVNSQSGGSASNTPSSASSSSASAAASVTANSSAAASSTATASTAARAAAATREQSQFQALKRQLDSYAAKHGFSSEVHTAVEARGLVIRVLTDRLLFASGSATLDEQAHPLLEEVAALLNLDRSHPIAVEGNTDDVPIHSGSFPSNWELSTARASMVVRFLIDSGVSPQRMTAAGYAYLHPIASNATAQGRAQNRRVEIVLQRIYASPTAAP